MLVSTSTALAIVIAASPAILRAQVVDCSASRAASAKQRNIRIINSGDRHLGVVLAATVVALVPFDPAIGRAARQPALQNNSTLRETAVQLNRAAFPGATFASYAVYAAGVLTASEQTLDAGFHILESVFVASNVTDVLKRAVGRARPSVSSDPLRFDNGKDVDAYGRAHWASDVVAGAAVGMLSARAIVRTVHTHPGNWLDALAVHGVFAAQGRGRALLGWHMEAP